MKQELRKWIEEGHAIIQKTNAITPLSERFLATAIYELQQLINKIDVFLTDYHFESTNNEIDFFKNYLSPILAEYLYYKEVFNLSIGMPLYPEEYKKYYQSSAKKYASFKKSYLEQYTYYCGRQSAEDHVLFVRKEEQLNHLVDSFNFTNITLQTLARAYFLAIEKLIPQLRKTSQSPLLLPKAQRKLSWTGKNIVLVELIYILAYSKLINNGNITISELCACFEEWFGLDLKKNVYSAFQDVKNRKQPASSLFKILKDTFESLVSQ